MSEPYIGQIIMFAGDFAPKGWQFCQGQLLSIAQNSALFSILGTTYGGDGRTTFALPDLRGRVPIQPGQGPGLSAYGLGQAAGQENVTLLIPNIPAHNHTLTAHNGQGDSASPEGALPAMVVDPNTQQALTAFSTTPNTTMASASVSLAGGSQPHTNVQPYLCINFIIAIEGIYPSRP